MIHLSWVHPFWQFSVTLHTRAAVQDFFFKKSKEKLSLLQETIPKDIITLVSKCCANLRQISFVVSREAYLSEGNYNFLFDRVRFKAQPHQLIWFKNCSSIFYRTYEKSIRRILKSICLLRLINILHANKVRFKFNIQSIFSWENIYLECVKISLRVRKDILCKERKKFYCLNSKI